LLIKKMKRYDEAKKVLDLIDEIVETQSVNLKLYNAEAYLRITMTAGATHRHPGPQTLVLHCRSSGRSTHARPRPLPHRCSIKRFAGARRTAPAVCDPDSDSVVASNLTTAAPTLPHTRFWGRTSPLRGTAPSLRSGDGRGTAPRAIWWRRAGRVGGHDGVSYSPALSTHRCRHRGRIMSHRDAPALGPRCLCCDARVQWGARLGRERARTTSERACFRASPAVARTSIGTRPG